MISVDIDLEIETSTGLVLIENSAAQTIVVRLPNTKTLREGIRKRVLFDKMNRLPLTDKVLESHTFKIMIGSNELASLEPDKKIRGRKFYLGFQYLLAKLGF
jgi:hypothetical protein